MFVDGRAINPASHGVGATNACTRACRRNVRGMNAEIRLAMPHDIALLPAIECDADTLFLEVLDEVGRPRDALVHVCPARILDEARRAGRFWVVYSSSGRPVGFAMVVELGGYAHLDALAVHPSHGHGGLGGALVEAVCVWARAD